MLPAAPRGGLPWVIPHTPSSSEPLQRQYNDPEQHTHSKPSSWKKVPSPVGGSGHSHMWELFGELLSKPTSYPMEARKERKWLSPNLLKSEIFLKRRKGSAKILAGETLQGCGQVPTQQRRREELPFVGSLEYASHWVGHLPNHDHI